MRIFLALLLTVGGCFGQAFTLNDPVMTGQPSSAAVWSPTNNPDGLNPVAWYNANDVAAGVLSLWPDRTTNHYNLSATGASRPTVLASANGTNNVVAYFGAQRLRAAVAVTPLPYEVVIVLSITNTTAAQVIVDSTNGSYSQLYVESGSSPLWHLDSPTDITLPIKVVSNSFVCMDYIMSDPAHWFWTNNTFISISGTIGANGLNGLCLGGQLVTGRPMTGAIAECLVFAQTNSPTARSNLYSKWLKPIWGLP